VENEKKVRKKLGEVVKRGSGRTNPPIITQGSRAIIPAGWNRAGELLTGLKEIGEGAARKKPQKRLREQVQRAGK